MSRRQELEAFLSQKGKQIPKCQISKDLERSKSQSPGPRKASALGTMNSQSSSNKRPNNVTSSNAPKLPRFRTYNQSTHQKTNSSAFLFKSSSALSPKETVSTKSDNTDYTSPNKNVALNYRESEKAIVCSEKTYVYLGDCSLTQSVNLAEEMGLMMDLPLPSKSLGDDPTAHSTQRHSDTMEAILKSNEILLKLKRGHVVQDVFKDASPYISKDNIFSKGEALKSVEQKLTTILNNYDKIRQVLKRPRTLHKGLRLNPKYHRSLNQSLSQTVKLLVGYDDKIPRQNDLVQSICSQKDQLIYQSDQISEMVSLIKTLDDYSTEFNSLLQKSMAL